MAYTDDCCPLCTVWPTDSLHHSVQFGVIWLKSREHGADRDTVRRRTATEYTTDRQQLDTVLHR